MFPCPTNTPCPGTCCLDINISILENWFILSLSASAKCFLGTVVQSVLPNKAYIKILIVNSEFNDYFHKEANILPCCCHPNVSYLFGVWQQSTRKMLTLSFHGINSQSYSLHLCCSLRKKSTLDLSSMQWKSIVLGIISGIYYIHEKSINS